VNEDDVARLQLLAAIEGGSVFWCNEVREWGAPTVVGHFLSGFYQGEKNAASAIALRIRENPADKLIEEIETSGSFIITPNHEDWPLQVDDLQAPPFALVGKGDRSLLTRDSLAIVGSRNPTSYGVRMANEFAAGFADRDFVVVSGGAYGIDTAAHRGSLAAEGPTIAVLGGGVVDGYPSGNEKLFREIEESGLLIAEVMPRVHAVPHRFLIRNRLIAALSKGTLVVEAAYRSGSLRTARDASDLMRTVMAIPGSITSPASEGCHRLIAQREAELVSSVGDVMELVLPLLDARIEV
jgi:DNA processing protein